MGSDPYVKEILLAKKSVLHLNNHAFSLEIFLPPIIPPLHARGFGAKRRVV